MSAKSNTKGGKANIEAVAQRCSVKEVFLKISQNSQENTCARVYFLIKLQASPSYSNQSINQLTGFYMMEELQFYLQL